jgi:hypothetical protein
MLPAGGAFAPVMVDAPRSDAAYASGSGNAGSWHFDAASRQLRQAAMPNPVARI